MSPILGIIASSISGSISANSYESIATVTLSANQSSISFTSIPSTYKHLQIRGIARNSSVASNDVEGLLVYYNGDTGLNYSAHYLQGNGSTAYSAALLSTGYMYSGYTPTNGDTANVFSATIIDILDYADTNKYKTQRVLTGVNTNVSGTETIALFSGSWRSTSAISSITLYSTSARNFRQYSSFALYGVK